MSSENRCVEWTGCRDRLGYGRQHRKGKDRLAHRQAWIDAHGPIPDGLFVLHKCDNRACMNVQHLFLGTQLENIADRVRKGRSASGMNNKRTKATPEVIASIRASSESSRALASRLGVSHTTVLDVRRQRQSLAKSVA